MHECICNLSGIAFKEKTAREGQPLPYEVTNEPDEEDIESLCKLLATIGKSFDHARTTAHVQKMDTYMVRLSQLGQASNYNSRFRLMCKDTVDLRRRKWKGFAPVGSVTKGNRVALGGAGSAPQKGKGDGKASSRITTDTRVAARGNPNPSPNPDAHSHPHPHPYPY
jgi:hypothetical protein